MQIRLAKALRMGVSVRREDDMDTVTQLVVLSLATVVAAGAAFAMVWTFLTGAIRLMSPAAVTKTRPMRVELSDGVRAAARQFVRS